MKTNTKITLHYKHYIFIIQTMISIEVVKYLAELGSRLRQARLKRNEAQARFAARLGISIPTLRKMEKGDPSVQVGLWAEALSMLDRIDDFEALLKKRGTLFDRWEEKQHKIRKRASKRKMTHD